MTSEEKNKILNINNENWVVTIYESMTHEGFVRKSFDLVRRASIQDIEEYQKESKID